MRPHRFDFPVITNSDYTEELSFQDGAQYLDITGHSFLAQIRVTPNAASVIDTLGIVASSAAEGFYPVDPARGSLQVRIAWESIKSMFEAAYPTILIGDVAALYYDLLVTLPSGDQEAWLFGYLIIDKGITNG
ncbi:hypothetical protein [Croceibacterium aestuarii]|uniref:hypothetical protein n=1 Tax=Croceibacterium aestuarii TaxID=3064139 RepID=UPI00272DD0D4|nr:hypothetical protein [Croceibacterium sp. D39]